MKLPTSKRLEQIVDQLEKYGYVKAQDLSKEFRVSMETIRKDLVYLEEKGVVQKEYGGASILQTGIEKSYEFREGNRDAKKEIGRYVARLVQEQNSLILDAGSTCCACVQYLNLLSRKDIFTKSISAFSLLNGDTHNVYLAGGRKREKNSSLIGPWSEQIFSSIHVDVCFLGTAGLLDALGPTSHSYEEIALKKIMIQQSDLVYVLADASKFQEKGLHTICSWDQIDGIITDHTISPKVMERLKGVPIYVANEEDS